MSKAIQNAREVSTAVKEATDDSERITNQYLMLPDYFQRFLRLYKELISSAAVSLI